MSFLESPTGALLFPAALGTIDEGRNSKLETGNLSPLVSDFWFRGPLNASQITGLWPYFRFDGAFWRSKTSSFCALRRANSFLFNRTLASFRLFSIFFESSVYLPQRPGRLSNLFRASCDGVLHRSTAIAYHNSRLVSRAKMREVRSQKVGTRQ